MKLHIDGVTWNNAVVVTKAKYLNLLQIAK